MTINASLQDAGFQHHRLQLHPVAVSASTSPSSSTAHVEYEPVRFNEMQRYLKRVTDKTSVRIS